LEMQNEELRQTQHHLELARDRYAELYNFAPVGYFTLSAKGLIVEANLTGATLLGLERSTLLKQRFTRFIAPESEDTFYLHRKHLLEGKAPQTCQLTMLKQDGTQFEAQLECTHVEQADQIRVALMDITARVQAETELQQHRDHLEEMVQDRTAQLQTALAEKEALLAEIHHRVKNNLNIVSTLLNLQADWSEDESVRSILHDSEARIQNIARIHEQLYSRPNLAHIDMAAQIKSLAADLWMIHRRSDRSIDLKIEASGLYLPVKKAVTWTLLINELLTNALKYAFPPGRECSPDFKPEIRVTFQPETEDHYTLTVSDNGAGLPPDFHVSSQKTLGLYLIDLFARQLQATVEWPAGQGTTCKIRMKDEG